MAILVTGGLGYIGSHTCVELLENGYDVIVVDNLSNSSEVVKGKIESISGKKIKFYKNDLLEIEKTEKIFEENEIEAVMDFAALKAIGESNENPLKYHSNNLQSVLILLNLMKKYKVRNFVFSSSATVYGMAKEMPINEEAPLSVTNPYGRTKLIAEDILRDLAESDPWWNIVILRYFNPAGAHKSGIIGEDPREIPSNIMPYISKVAGGELECVTIFGDDYDTLDGTGVRDYIHVMDVAKGHIKALQKLVNDNPGLVTYNLGTGRGYSVLQLIEAFSKAANKEIPYKIAGRRKGDIAICYADCSKANRELDWKAEMDIDEMCVDGWRWQTN